MSLYFFPAYHREAPPLGPPFLVKPPIPPSRLVGFFSLSLGIRFLPRSLRPIASFYVRQAADPGSPHPSSFKDPVLPTPIPTGDSPEFISF